MTPFRLLISPQELQAKPLKKGQITLALSAQHLVRLLDLMSVEIDFHFGDLRIP